MPRRDRRGPWGLGPGSGRGFGPCVGRRAPRRARYFGRNFGPGYGRGPGFGFWAAGEDNDRSWLEDQRDFLKSQLEAIEDYLQEE